jgi:RNA polymerase sigma-70 factor
MTTPRQPERRPLFEALARDHGQALHVFLRARVRDPGVADDLFQETLVAAWQSLDRFDPQQSFGRWLRGIARNLLRNHHTRTVREQYLADAAYDDAIEQHCQNLQRLRTDLLDERLQRLRECIAGLPADYRRAIRVRYEDGQRGDALATALAASWDSVAKRLQRARRLLLQCFQRHLEPLSENP